MSHPLLIFGILKKGILKDTKVFSSYTLPKKLPPFYEKHSEPYGSECRHQRFDGRRNEADTDNGRAQRGRLIIASRKSHRPSPLVHHCVDSESQGMVTIPGGVRTVKPARSQSSLARG